MLDRALLLLALTFAFGGCTTLGPDAEESEAPPVEWGTGQVDEVARALADGLVQSPEASYLVASSADDLRVSAHLAGFVNETNQPVHAPRLLAALQRALHQTGRFRLITDDSGGWEKPRQIPRMTAEKARAQASDLGAQIALFVAVRTVTAEEAGRERPRAVKLVLECLAVESGEPICSTARQVDRSPERLFAAAR